MKGLTKAIMRTPHMMGARVGLSKKSNDPEFDDYSRKFTAMESATDKLFKDSKTFADAVISLLSSETNFAQHFAGLFEPLGNEYDILGKHPEAQETIRNLPSYQREMEELKEALSPELELIQTRIIGPVKELQGIMKGIRKSITKRDHKLIDYDRFNNSLTKLRDKKEKSLNDEKNLFKLEQDFEVASNEFEFHNTTLKTELPQFMILATRFIDPLFHSFYYMQLNIFYLMLEKINGFASGKYDVSLQPADVATAYEARLGDARDRVEALTITKRAMPTAKMLSMRQGSSPSGTSAGERRAPPSLAAKPSVLAGKPPLRSNSYAAPPPAYQEASFGDSPAAAAASSAGTKRAPPPPPPLKPKPGAPAVKYVTALYDFAAQAEGDLEFRVGDKIELVERTASSEDWWTGKLNGRTGVFPGNYVQE
ncbi:BAR-domain-containing protein [Dacryopinax primogenitus]|uniref:BAR-domain-containing protein n=1 Tax=Dacryopinax primogenitus (strain DJM 731) TaxID=1858805 RepID=M5FU03_DACPD|nr:BAR-domain-containing protein [Dacryopinax primogenitus]EJT98964.1 BAR-domain-containing protein [Dacryopinax primogenitus]